MIIYIKFPKWFKYNGITLFPLIFIDLVYKGTNTGYALERHEIVHIRQRLELGFLPYYVIYCTMYLYNIVKYRNHNTAYTMIPFEMEAYDSCGDLFDGQPITGDIYGWFKYV